MYFKSQWAANCWLNKPIISIPLKYIQAVQRYLYLNSFYILCRVKVKWPSKKRKTNDEIKLEAYNDFQFEIFVKDGIDFGEIIRRNDMTVYEIRQRQQKSLERGEGEKDTLVVDIREAKQGGVDSDVGKKSLKNKKIGKSKTGIGGIKVKGFHEKTKSQEFETPVRNRFGEDSGVEEQMQEDEPEQKRVSTGQYQIQISHPEHQNNSDCRNVSRARERGSLGVEVFYCCVLMW